MMVYTEIRDREHNVSDDKYIFWYMYVYIRNARILAALRV